MSSRIIYGWDPLILFWPAKMNSSRNSLLNETIVLITVFPGTYSLSKEQSGFDTYFAGFGPEWRVRVVTNIRMMIYGGWSILLQLILERH